MSAQGRKSMSFYPPLADYEAIGAERDATCWMVAMRRALMSWLFNSALEPMLQPMDVIVAGLDFACFQERMKERCRRVDAFHHHL